MKKIPVAIKIHCQLTIEKTSFENDFIIFETSPQISQNSAKFYKKTDCLDRVLKICHSGIANKPLRKPHNLEKLNFSITI